MKGLFVLFLAQGGGGRAGPAIVNGMVDVPLRNSKYNYLVDYMFEGTSYAGVVDTRSHLIVPMTLSSSSAQGACVSHLIDGTMMNFSSCHKVSGPLQVGGATAELNVSFATQQYVANPLLHSWTQQTGIFGLNYPSETGTMTSFEALLEVTNSSLFGLDLNADEALSSLQLGGVSQTYADSLAWSPSQPFTSLDHTFFLHHPEFCGVPLMANWSNNWPVVVDTASVCLTLPSEYYHLFLAWFNLTISTGTSSMDGLPALSFSLSPSTDSSRLYISLSDLLINTSDIKTEQVPHLIAVPALPQELSLCVVEGDTIDDPRRSDLATPPIIFGALTLRSLYFAGDMRTQRVAFANKHPPDGGGSSTQCLPPRQCRGESNLDRDYNVCMKPDCSRYFYVSFNHDTGMCEYNNGAYVVGLLFLTFIACLEVLTFFTTQYTFFEHSYYSSLRFKPDPVTQLVGFYLLGFFDFLRVSVFGWSSEEGTVVGHMELNEGEEEEDQGEEEQGEGQGGLPEQEQDRRSYPARDLEESYGTRHR
jgi:hypothetical protein